MHIISRRDFIRSTVLCGIGASVMSCRSNILHTRQTNTRYIAAYDTESPNCLAACRKIVKVHKQFEMPATFFIVGRTLDANPAEYREILDDPLFEIATHTYSHRMLRDNEFCGPAISLEEKQKEIFGGKDAVERVFERPCIGLRPGCGFDNALKGEPAVLELLRQAGIQYVSSLLWGPDYSLPALLREPFNYKDEGFPEIWELPGHGWHENLLKDHNQWGPRRLTLCVARASCPRSSREGRLTALPTARCRRDPRPGRPRHVRVNHARSEQRGCFEMKLTQKSRPIED